MSPQARAKQRIAALMEEVEISEAGQSNKAKVCTSLFGH
jgi:hypothetical protein